MIRHIKTQARLASPFAHALAFLAAFAASFSDARSATTSDLSPNAPFETPQYASDTAFYSSLGIDIQQEVSRAQWHLATIVLNQTQESDRLTAVHGDPLSTYETTLPHTTQPRISRFEKALLTAYLDHPDDTDLATFLAIHHLSRSLLRPTLPAKKGKALAHTIIALYFLNRVKDTGSKAVWVARVLRHTQSAVDQVFDSAQPITSDEYHRVHLYYRKTFHLNQEQNRYIALSKLLQDFSKEPRNVYTSFALTALNLWVGGEADYDDPTTLYNFVLGSYFSLHTINLAHQLELAWDAEPFRMAATLGGFSLLQRRWLATLHRDQEAIALIDDEHRLWRAIQPAFHAFTFGLPFFDEEEHFAEGLAGYAAGVPFCQAVPVRTCSDLPRFPFNLLSYFLGYIDFLLKDGALAGAQQLITFNQLPFETDTFAQWDLGRDAWEHRANNLEAIMALYRNDDPSDDPINFEMKRRKWGENTTTCQVCHQTQGKPQTAADINAPQTLPPPEVANIGMWPPVTTAWYGAVQRP